MVALSRPCRFLPRKRSLFSSCLPLSIFSLTTAELRTLSRRATNVLARSTKTTTTSTTTHGSRARSTGRRHCSFLCDAPLKLGRLSHHVLQEQQQQLQRRLFSSNVVTATRHSRDDRNAIDVDDILSLKNLPLYQYVRKMLRSKSLPETQVITYINVESRKKKSIHDKLISRRKASDSQISTCSPFYRVHVTNSCLAFCIMR